MVDQIYQHSTWLMVIYRMGLERKNEYGVMTILELVGMNQPCFDHGAQ
jgi:hypothetical protein